MDGQTAIFVTIVSVCALIALIALIAIGRNEYIYRLNKPADDVNEDITCLEGCIKFIREKFYCFSICCSKCVKIKIHSIDEELGNETNPIEENKVTPPPKSLIPSVDIMFIIRRLKKDQMITSKHVTILSRLVATKDPRLISLIKKHNEHNRIISRNEKLKTALVLLARTIENESKQEDIEETAMSRWQNAATEVIPNYPKKKTLADFVMSGAFRIEGDSDDDDNRNKHKNDDSNPTFQNMKKPEWRHT
mmetsp:Transcript_15841/g.18695  ORF Transcript_15841/g.18695 Transcript_15841/m.18695 type:complete len:249 (+) Transcript_15841:66-812(+)